MNSIDTIKNFVHIASKEKEEKYDSRPETYEHINLVREGLNKVIKQLLYRGEKHDRSKLVSPEVECFDKYTQQLKACTYGSEEYKEFLSKMKVGLDHHYSKNSHHPEFYENGIKGMSLLDIVEMIIDWHCACKRHSDGDIKKSIEQNQKRFDYSDELKQIFLNTVEELYLD